MKGRKPKLALHQAEATHQATAPSQPPQPPEHLDDEGREIFAALAAELAAQGTLHNLDAGILALYAGLASQLAKAERGLAEHGLVIKSVQGAAVASPFHGIALRCAKELRAIAGELGLTPQSRQRLPKPQTAAPVLKRKRRA